MSDRQLRQPPNPYLNWRRCAECGQSEFDAWQEGREFEVESERARCQTWVGIMEALALHYPPDIIDGSSGDPGPQIVVLVREIDQLRTERDLAIAHDRQPYPTADAYERVCAAAASERARYTELVEAADAFDQACGFGDVEDVLRTWTELRAALRSSEPTETPTP